MLLYFLFFVHFLKKNKQKKFTPRRPRTTIDTDIVSIFRVNECLDFKP